MPPGGVVLDLRCADAYDVVRTLADASVHLVYFDPPYGMTRFEWDQPIDLHRLWPELWRALVPGGAVIIHSCMPFTVDVINSQREAFRYSYVWHKSRKTGFLNANHQPLRVIEDVCVFYKRQPATYNPQMSHVEDRVRRIDNSGGEHSASTSPYGRVNRTYRGYHPTNYINEPSDTTYGMKPIKLVEFMIRTYTNEGDVVVDLTMHRAVTGVACLNTGRAFVGAEIHPPIFNSAVEAVLNAMRTSSPAGDWCIQHEASEDGPNEYAAVRILNRAPMQYREEGRQGEADPGPPHVPDVMGGRRETMTGSGHDGGEEQDGEQNNSGRGDGLATHYDEDVIARFATLSTEPRIGENVVRLFDAFDEDGSPIKVPYYGVVKAYDARRDVVKVKYDGFPMRWVDRSIHRVMPSV